MSDQDRISPYSIQVISCRQVIRIRKNINYRITYTYIGLYLLLFWYQILQTNIMIIIWQIVRRMTNEILGVKGLINRCHVAMCLFNNLTKMTSNYDKSWKLTLKAQLSVSQMFLPHSDIFWVPTSDQDRISPHTISIIPSRHVMRIKKISIRGLLVDPIPNSPN